MTVKPLRVARWAEKLAASRSLIQVPPSASRLELLLSRFEQRDIPEFESWVQRRFRRELKLIEMVWKQIRKQELSTSGSGNKMTSRHSHVTSTNSPPTRAPLQELKRLYRRLALRVHPDVSTFQFPEFKDFWHQIQLAYAAKDLFQLRKLTRLLESGKTADLPSSNQSKKDLHLRVKNARHDLAWNFSMQGETPRLVAHVLESLHAELSHLTQRLIDLEDRAHRNKNHYSTHPKILKTGKKKPL